MNDNIPIFFYFSLAKAYPSLQDSDEFFDLMNDYLKERVPTMTQKQCEVLLDTWKFNAYFITTDLKSMLSERKNDL